MTLLSVEAAQRRIASLVRPVPTEIIPLRARSVAYCLPIFARSLSPCLTTPRWTASRCAQTICAVQTSVSPCELLIVADIPAGRTSSIRLRRGQAARIMTGAPLPPGADAVVMLEDTDHAANGRSGILPKSVRLYDATKSGVNVRRKGSDLAAGRNRAEHWSGAQTAGSRFTFHAGQVQDCRAPAPTRRRSLKW